MSDVSPRPPQIWVDADACPRPMREMLFKAARRTGVQVTLVANHPLPVPALPNVTFRQVEKGFDVADNALMEWVNRGDLVITQDTPLASDLLAKGAEAVSPRGVPWSPDTIRSKLAMRDFMETLRASGVQTGGPSTLGPAEKQAFAAVLDRWLARVYQPALRRSQSGQAPSDRS